MILDRIWLDLGWVRVQAKEGDVDSSSSRVGFITKGLGFIWVKCLGVMVHRVRVRLIGFRNFWVDIHHLDEYRLKTPVEFQPEVWVSRWFRVGDGGFQVVFVVLGKRSSCS